MFGLDLFEAQTSQFDANVLGAVDPNYRFGPGDVMNLVMTGDFEPDPVVADNMYLKLEQAAPAEEEGEATEEAEEERDRRQLRRPDDERLDLGRVRPKTMGGVVVGSLDAAEKTVGGGRHGVILGRRGRLGPP